MKRIHPYIVVVQENDTEETITSWFHNNDKDHSDYNITEGWLHTLKPDDVVICNPSSERVAVYKLNIDLLPEVNMLTLSTASSMEGKENG